MQPAELILQAPAIITAKGDSDKALAQIRDLLVALPDRDGALFPPDDFAMPDTPGRNHILALEGEGMALHAAISANVDYPYICKTGNCAAYISELRSGRASMLPYSNTALSPRPVRRQQDSGLSGSAIAGSGSCLAVPRAEVTSFSGRVLYLV